MKTKIVVTLLATLLLAGCDKPVPEVMESVRPVKIFTVEDSGQNGVRYFPARLQAGDETQLSFKRAGQLQQLLVREGEQVKKGQNIAMLNNTDLTLRVRDRQSAFNLARDQFNRFNTLQGRNAISRAELDIRRAELESAQAALDIARKELSDATISAPFDGVIANVSARNHQVMAPGQVVATLSALDSLDVVFSVPERLFTALDIGNKDYHPTVRLNHLPDREFLAEYKEHTTSTSAGSMTFQVTLTMKRPPDLPLLSGISGSVRINTHKLTGSTNASIIVPVEAVFNPDSAQLNDARVWVVKEDKGQLHVEEREVQVGQLTANGIQITSGLSDGEQIVAAGTSELRPQQLVRAWVRERGL
ncbi:putative lipoprotein [Yersinia nurmii]|uniref:Lipoprotein n=1 Tax=Yersinia nurmii TaxID=685706 RepID=A0ABM9SJ94_9GAMM|nr:efflux RND transporter periplasmic adaptor subunit [Yersinia nurmii]CNE73975.1 putative lipoprotein [Yersinia nurmii]